MQPLVGTSSCVFSVAKSLVVRNSATDCTERGSSHDLLLLGLCVEWDVIHCSLADLQHFNVTVADGDDNFTNSHLVARWYNG